MWLPVYLHWWREIIVLSCVPSFRHGQVGSLLLSWISHLASVSLNPEPSGVTAGSWLWSLCSSHRFMVVPGCSWLFLAVVTVLITLCESRVPGCPGCSWLFLIFLAVVTVPSTHLSPCHEDQLTPMAAVTVLAGQGGCSTASHPCFGRCLDCFYFLNRKLCLSLAVSLYSEYCKRAHLQIKVNTASSDQHPSLLPEITEV